MSKNIETCKSEEVLSSVLDQQPQDYPSVQQAVHDLGVTALPAASAADPDIAELPSNVDVFVRRVLKAVVYDRVLPVVQQMWQAVLNRISSPNYLPDSLRPYASNPSLRTLGTLPTAISALAPRKISNGGATNDGIPDGVSLAHIICDSSIYGAIPELIDDNHGWTLTRSIDILKTLFPNTQVFRLGFKKSNQDIINSSAVFDTLILDDYEGGARIVGNGGYGYGVKNLYAPKMTWLNAAGGYTPSFGNKLVHLYAPKWAGWNGSATTSYGIVNCPDLVFAEIGDWTDANTSKYLFYNCPNLIEVRLNEQSHSLNLASWNPTDKGTAFLDNFLHHIAERLAVGPTTNRLTLTLSADVYSACGFGATIDDPTDIRYLIKKAIQDRNWKVTDGTNNFNQ